MYLRCMLETEGTSRIRSRYQELGVLCTLCMLVGKSLYIRSIYTQRYLRYIRYINWQFSPYIRRKYLCTFVSLRCIQGTRRCIVGGTALTLDSNRPLL